MSQPAQPLGRLRRRWFLLTGAIIALGLALAACGQDGTSGGPTATKDVFEDSTGFKRPTPAFQRHRILDTPGPRRVLLPTLPPPTPDDTPTSPPTTIPHPPGSPLGLLPVPDLLDCEYLRQNQGTVGVKTFTIQGDQNPLKLNDYLEGTEGPDVIDGGEGNDVIYGLGGDDIICGGPGLDTIYGDDGADFLYGEAGQDVLYGGAGNDILLGGPGSDGRIDTEGSAGGIWKGLDGGPGDDWLHGGDGEDWLEGGFGKDILFAGMGDDSLYGDNKVDTEAESCLGAEPCADWLFGGFGDDQLHGGPGNDSLVGDIFTPKSLMTGSTSLTGPDTHYPPDWLIYVDLYDGDQLIQKAEPLPEYGNDEIRGEHGHDWLFDPGSDVSGTMKNVMNGAEGNDILVGGENGDYMWGGYGNDKLWGRDGNDSLIGGVWGDPSLASEGYDELYGGAGDDSLDAAEVKIGGPGDDLCKDHEILFTVICDDDQ